MDKRNPYAKWVLRMLRMEEENILIKDSVVDN